MWDNVNKSQTRVIIITAVILLLMILFPPLSIERTISGLSDGRNSLSLTSREFDGWGFIGQVDVDPPAQRIEKPKDPMNPTLLERFEAARPLDLEDLRRGKKRIDFGTLLKEIIVLLALGGVALFLTRTKPDVS